MIAMPSCDARPHPVSLHGLRIPDGTASTMRHLHKKLPSEHKLVLGHSLGEFFIMGSHVTEIFSVFDSGADAPDVVKLTRHAQTMRVASLRSASASARTFELVRARLLEPFAALEATLNNVYADQAPEESEFA